jgi:hypothetical protein
MLGTYSFNYAYDDKYSLELIYGSHHFYGLFIS